MSREKGDKLEKKVADLLDIKQTAKSGGHWDNADLANEKMLIECKSKSIPNLRVPKKELEKLMAQAKKHSKDWVYVQENDSGTYVVLSLDYFVEIFIGLAQR